MYKEDLALNNLQWLICHKTKQFDGDIYSSVLIDVWFVEWGFSFLFLQQQNPFTQVNMDIDMLVMKTYLPKDVTKRNNSMVSAGMSNFPQMMGILRPFDEIYRNLKPAQPLHQSPHNNKYDVVFRHGQQAQEIRNNYRKGTLPLLFWDPLSFFFLFPLFWLGLQNTHWKILKTILQIFPSFIYVSFVKS